MSNEAKWLAEFTGLDVGTGQAAGGDTPDPAALAREFAELQALKQAALADARRELALVKASFQQAMSNDVAVKGKRQKEKLLAVTKTQADEAEFEDIDFGGIELEPATVLAIDKGNKAITNAHERLKAMTWGPKKLPLFSPPELQREFWTPLVRERILPETFVAAIYSETQQMLDATNEAYEAAVAEKAAKGELTPEANRGRAILDSGAELLSVAGSLAGLGGDAPGAALAKSILTTASTVVTQGANVVDKLKAKEFTDASSLALDAIRDLTGAVLTQAGLPDNTVKAVASGFASGNAAIKAGKAFATGADGAGEGAGHFAMVIESALGAAVAVTTGEQQENLRKAVAIVPAAFRQAKIVAELRQKIVDGDTQGIVQCLVASADNGLKSVRSFQLVEATKGKSAQESADITKQFEADSEKLSTLISTGGSGAEAAVKFALLAQQGKHLSAINGLIQDIGGGLEKALTAAGVGEAEAKTISSLYSAAASAPAAFAALAKPQPDIDGAMAGLADGIDKAFASFAGNDAGLKTAGEALSQSVRVLGKGAPTVALFRQGKVNEGVEGFITTVQTGLDGALKVGNVVTDDGKTDPAAAKLLAQMKAVGDAVAGKKEMVAAGLDKAVKELRSKRNAEEAAAIMEEAKDDLAQMEAAEKAAADASAIDTLIAKMERDRMVMRIAVQIVEGGSAFAAKFVPGLGAAGAAAQLAAHLYAAAMRAQQLYRWTQNQSDLEAAQSALSTSAQNFVKNQAEQFAHYAIQSALQAAKLIGEIATVSGVAGPAGAALSATASAGTSLQKIIEDHYKRETLEKAWKVTAAALRNPTNRKLGLKARALNPTLAKYSIAWGAVVAKDPLARNAMRACDLNEAALKNPGSNVGKVVEYLEKFYEDDAQLYRELEKKADWLPKDLGLSLRSWSEFKRNAKQKVGLDTGGTGLIDGLLVEWEKAEAATPPAEVFMARRLALTKREEVLGELDAAFGAWVPKLAGGKRDDKALELVGNAVKLLRRQVRGSLKACAADGVELAAAEEAWTAAQAQGQSDKGGTAPQTSSTAPPTTRKRA